MRDRLIFVSTLTSAILNIILWFIVAGKFGFSADKVALHFNVVYGIDFLGSARQIYQIPLAGLVIGLVNFFLSVKIYAREKLFSYILSLAGLAVQILLLVAVLVLAILNA